MGDFRGRYDKIKSSKWFKDAYENKSLGPLSLIEDSVDLEGEVVDLVNQHFWELIGPSQTKNINE